jgi:adenylate cyclase
LAAILVADVAGYSRLMHENEDAIISAWQSARHEIIDPIIAERDGRIVKHTGDGFLAEFPTVQSAVECAAALQERLVENPLEFRMDVHLGDIVDDGEDIHGDGVNIAARLEGLADPGGICISSDVYNQVHNKLSLTYEDMGEQKVDTEKKWFLYTLTVRFWLLADLLSRSDLRPLFPRKQTLMGFDIALICSIFVLLYI